MPRMYQSDLASILLYVYALLCVQWTDACSTAIRTPMPRQSLREQQVRQGPWAWDLICGYVCIYIYIYTHTEREREMYMYEHMISYYITPQTLYNKWFNIILWPVSHWGVHDQTPKSVPCAVKRDTAFPVSTSYASLQIFQIPHDPRLERQAHYVYVYYMHICM